MDTVRKPNPNPNRRKAPMNERNDLTSPNICKMEKDAVVFEFCEVCNLNHNQGRRHKYFPTHVNSFSSIVSRFRKKLSNIRLYLKNPIARWSDHASDRLWCVFCNCEIDQADDSLFAFGTAIHHLASVSHLKNTKSFLWKHGGKMDQVDSLRILEAELVKWEKKCRLLQSDGANETTHRPLNNIHIEINSKCIDTLSQNIQQSINSSYLNGVLPLQKNTDERHQFTGSEPSSVGDNQYLYVHSEFETVPWNTNYVTGTSNIYARKDSISIEGGVHLDGETVTREIVNKGLNRLTKISIPQLQQDGQGNVHSGAPPPWFDAAVGGDHLKYVGQKSESRLKQGGKSKLNPNRVGAAWAEQRKMEIEMEKRGEIVSTDVDPNWLPNFGRVWESGTRKKSRKEFESEEKNKSANNKVDDSESEASIKIQPYVSKRMRMTEASDS